MLEGDGYRVVGVTLGGPDPLGSIQLPLEPGVTALYGRNGSGKSRTLHAIAEVVEGLARPLAFPETREMLVEVDPSAVQREPDRGSWLADARDALASALANEARQRARQTDPYDVFDALTEPPSTVRELISAITDVKLWVDVPSLAGNVANAGLLVVVARSGQLECGPAVSFDTMVELDADWVLWDSLQFVDGMAEMQLGIRQRDLTGSPKLDVVSLFADRLLDLNAIADLERGNLAATAYRENWNAYPVGGVGVIRSSPVRLAGWTVDEETLRSRTVAALREAAPRLVEAVLEEEVVFTSETTATVERLVSRAAHLLSLTLLDAPALRLRLGEPDEWLAGEAPVWEAQDGPSGEWLELHVLSQAQRRWCVLAIELALAELTDRGRPTLVLLDEPEGALHRGAERHLVTGLKRLAVELGGAAVIVATHSPAFLADAGVRHVHIHRARGGRAIASELQVAIQGELDQEASRDALGLGTADLLQLARVAVVVEGAHDEATLEVVASRELLDSGGLVLRMRGARNAVAVLDARLLMTMTDARVLVVVDNVTHKRIAKLWTALKGAAKRADFDRARSIVRDIGRIDGAEPAWLAELADRAIAIARVDRIEVFGLAKPDILFYFDPHHFRLSDPWAHLHREWSTLPRDERADFKSWLRREKGASISTQRVRAAAGALDSVPGDLRELRETITRLSIAPTD